MITSFVFKDLEKKHKANQNTLSDKVEGIALKCSMNFCTVHIFLYIAYNCCSFIFKLQRYSISMQGLSFSRKLILAKYSQMRNSQVNSTEISSFKVYGLYRRFYPFYFLIALFCSHFNVFYFYFLTLVTSLLYI